MTAVAPVRPTSANHSVFADQWLLRRFGYIDGAWTAGTASRSFEVINPADSTVVETVVAIMREETFGPVAALAPFDTEGEELARANDAEYGLVAYLHTQNPRRIFHACRTLQYAMVAVNRTKITHAPIPFGGMKQSGVGREGARQGMEAFTELKHIWRNWA